VAKAAKGWTLDEVPWDTFDGAEVDPGLLAAVKAAALVEHNGLDYEAYLHKVFHDDPEFRDAASAWAGEEVRHGEALARWAAMADPGFDFAASFRRFRAGYSLPLDVDGSVRGSRAGELVARCVVECGTSSFYSALRDATREPLLKDICGRLAADEFRHYKLFYTHLQRYLEREDVGPWRRLWVALERILERDDDELSFAYYCGNDLAEPYDRRACARAYQRRAFSAYRPGHVQRGLRMLLKAAGMAPRGLLGRVLGRLAWRYLAFHRA
jgi:hypothetical protein